MIIQLAIALSNIIGLILFLFCLAYGLVTIPLNLWHYSDMENNRGESLTEVGRLHAKKINAQAKLEENLQKLRRLDHLVAKDDPMRAFVSFMLRRYAGDLEELTQSKTESKHFLDDINRKNMVALNAAILLSQRSFKRSQ